MTGHYPVMLPEVLEALQPTDKEVYVDGTFGAGGYSAAIMDAADCRVVAIDRDVDARARAVALQEKYGERLVFLQGCFGDVKALLDTADFNGVDGFVLDLGVSSFQVDQAQRGFSFRFDGPLDMRMDGGGEAQTAADIVNSYAEDDLAHIIYTYGDERHSRRIARRIVERRRVQPFEKTMDLAQLVASVVPHSRRDKINPATKTFQALRIAVNDELGELERALDAAGSILKVGGRLVVVSFHSLEDGMVKSYLREASGAQPRGSKYAPEIASQSPSIFKLVSRKAIKPSQSEVDENARSRSARLRVAIRTEAVA